MGAYKYIQELWRKKQSDVMRFPLRVSCWQYCQLSALHRGPPPPPPLDKMCRLGYKAKQGYVIYRIRVRRSGCKCPVPKGATYAFSLLQRSELDIPHTNSLRLSSLIHSIKLSEEILTPSGSPNRSPSTGRCESWHLQAARAVALEKITSSTTPLVVLAVRLEEDAMLSSSTVTVNTSNVCKILT
uniref:Ribosomal protein L15 n=1 Tax=Suricata suricatta TaxID=37032 RepID=A0A673VSS5_SURSU